MERSIYKDLVAWKHSMHRKPLMLYGARQVGKTYILKEFGRREFKNMVYLNCYKNEAIATLFSKDTNVERLLLGLSALSDQPINPDSTLIFLDEVQDIPDVVASLKYFCEDAPEYCIVVAGSLLGVMNMEGISFPTGKVDMLHMYPMTYMEFLQAVSGQQKANLLKAVGQEELINSLSSSYIELLRQYYFVGGMPEAVVKFINTKTPGEVRKVQNAILAAYDADIAKHAGEHTQRARMVFESIPSQLAKENKKFVFGALRKGARAAEYEMAIQWLVDAGLIYKIPRLSKVAIPLSFYNDLDGFKLYLLDVGLLGAMSKVPASLMLIGNSVFSEFKGAFTENYVLEQMVVFPDLSIGYYSKENSSMEIDFIVQSDDRLLPIEVKAEKNVKSKSLRQFITVDNTGRDLYGYRFSMQGYERQDWMSNIPLYAIEPFLHHLSS